MPVVIIVIVDEILEVGESFLQPGSIPLHLLHDESGMLGQAGFMHILFMDVLRPAEQSLLQPGFPVDAYRYPSAAPGSVSCK